MRTSCRILSVALVAAIAPKAHADATGFNACALVTQAEVQPVLDNPITRVEPNARAYKIPVAPNGSCTYHAGLEAAVVALSKQSAAKGSSDWKITEATWFSSAQYHSEVVPAGQLGDRALWSENPKGAGGGYAVSKYPYLVNVVIAASCHALRKTTRPSSDN